MCVDRIRSDQIRSDQGDTSDASQSQLAHRYFINIASCGFSARVSKLVGWFKWLGSAGGVGWGGGEWRVRACVCV